MRRFMKLQWWYWSGAIIVFPFAVPLLWLWGLLPSWVMTAPRVDAGIAIFLVMLGLGVLGAGLHLMIETLCRSQNSK